MISQKSNQMMSTEILTFDSAILSPTDQSFFSDDCPQIQHCSEITPQLVSDDWLQDFEDIRNFCDGLEFSLNYEPEFTLEAMDKEVDTQYQTKANEIIDYLDSSAFMSPLSIEPSSPQTIDGHIVEQQLDSTPEITAMSLLEEILSANTSDSETLSDQCLDSELSLQLITEIPKEVESSPEPEISPKRQTKRKVQTNDTQSTKPTKRAKATVTERRERKRNQNKSAANRYRQKKRVEMDVIEEQQNHFIEINNKLKSELQKLQMEFKVVYPLAKAAFSSDPNKSLKLQMLDIRILSDNLLE
jgi:hypothetical protein